MCTHPWILSQQSVDAAVRLLFLFLRPDGYGEIANLATSFPPSTRRKDSTHMPTCPPTHLPTKLSRACRVYGGPVEGCKCNCRVQGPCSDAGADPGTFRHTILGIETKPSSSRSIIRQTLKDPAAVAVISTPTLARSLTRFAWLFSQAVRLESLRILGHLWLSRASCFQTHGCQNPCTKRDCRGSRHPSSLFLLSLICAALCLCLVFGCCSARIVAPTSLLFALVRLQATEEGYGILGHPRSPSKSSKSP